MNVYVTQYYKSNDVTNCTNCNLKEGIVCNQIGVGNMPNC